MTNNIFEKSNDKNIFIYQKIQMVKKENKKTKLAFQNNLFCYKAQDVLCANVMVF